MKISVSKGRLEDQTSNLMLIPLLEGETLPFQNKDITGEFKKLSLLYEGYKGNEKILFVGLGKKKDVDLEKVRKAFGMAVKKVKELKLEEFSVFFRKIPGLSDQEAANAMVEGIALGNYSFDKYKTKEKGEKEVKGFSLVYKGKGIWKGIGETAVVCDTVNFVRDMINENADVMTTEKMASLAKEIARKNKLKIKILEKKELEKLGMNLILAVGRGSRYPPKMLILEYGGDLKKKQKIAIIGKGVTFDSGGMNLKPSGWIEAMKQDMAGAATVLGVMQAVATLNLKVNLIAVTPLCENMIGPDSYKPGDVITAYSGKSVEVENTDAEGRLILADALAYTEKILKPSAIIDIATLTGAAFVIFGEYVTPLIGTDKSLMRKLFAAGEKTYDRVWQLPLYEEFKEEVKGDIADVTNIGYNKGRYAGTIMGAAFLNSFVEKTPLAHLDIGGTAYRGKARPGYIPKNATGAGVRLLVEFFKSLSR